MKISTKHINKHSEDEFAHKLRILSDSGAGIIHIKSQEVVRAYTAARKAILIGGNEYREWDVVNGVTNYTLSNMSESKIQGDGNTDIGSAMAIPMDELSASTDEDSFVYLSFINPQYWLEVPAIIHYLEMYNEILPPTSIRILLITPNISLPESISDLIVTLPFDTPSHNELKGYLEYIVEGVNDSSDTDNVISLSEEDYDEICHTGAGMSKASFEMYSSLSIVDVASGQEDISITSNDIIQGINAGKTEIVNKNDILELYNPEDMKNVGGMENLKAWVAKRAKCYSDEAREFGIEHPRGLVFVGISGTGKSLISKAIAREFGIPLVRLDFGKIFDSFVGKSEQRIKTALEMVESMSPICLLVDEVDKGLGGIGSGGGDSGTSSRVLGSFLTWLQENKSPVFTVLTANRITGLPPELLRRGRFDAIFGAGLPADEERLQVLNIHLKKRGYNPDDYSVRDKAKVVEVSKGYVPAEIESAVKDGLINAFSGGKKFTMKHVFEALRDMVPLSQTYAEQIQLMTTWIKGNATPASISYDKVPDPDNVTKIGKSKRTRISKKKD